MTNISNLLLPVLGQPSSLLQAGGSGGAAGWLSMLNPLAAGVAGLLSLFSGNDTAPLLPKVRLQKENYEAGFNGGGDGSITPVSRTEGGQYWRPERAAGVVVQVQAMDSRSFLDHSSDIAQAVKRALLESDGLSGVLKEY